VLQEKMDSATQIAINGLRVLSAEMVQNANSGHPGAPMGMAPCAYALWAGILSEHCLLGLVFAPF
jgi:transketolase